MRCNVMERFIDSSPRGRGDDGLVRGGGGGSARPLLDDHYDRDACVIPVTSIEGANATPVTPPRSAAFAGEYLSRAYMTARRPRKRNRRRHEWRVRHRARRRERDGPRASSIRLRAAQHIES